MNKYTVNVPFSGYSRGYIEYEIEAESEDAAKQKVRNGHGCEGNRIIVRDDTEKDWDEGEARSHD